MVSDPKIREESSRGGAPRARSSDRRRPARVVLCLGLALVFTLQLFMQLVEGRRSADKTIGIVLDEVEDGLVLRRVKPEGPAAVGGLRVADVLRRMNGHSVRTSIDYDVVAQDFESAATQIFSIERDGEALEVAVIPGVSFDWMSWALNALAATVHLAFGLLVLMRAGDDVRARLLWILLVAIGLELAMPTYAVGAPWVNVVTRCLFWLLTGLQFGVELHLASVIPQPQAWFRGRRWPRILYYGVGIGFGLLMFGSSLPGAEDSALFGWLWTPLGDTVTSGFFLVWMLGVVLLLGNSALRWPEPTGRQQALLVLMGVLPWAALTLSVTYWDYVGSLYPAWLGPVQPLLFLVYPVALFFAIFRYKLFDLEFVVRRSLVYGALSTVLLLVFFAALGAGGVALSALLEAVPSTAAVAGATLVLGLSFSPLKKLVERQIEHRFFPERVALRERLGDMVRDLPGRGQLPAMAETLVSDLVEIFVLKGASLLLADRDSDLLVGRASRGCIDGAHGMLVPKSDPFVEFLGDRGRATLAARWPRAALQSARLREMGGELAVPIMRWGELTGVLILGAKSDGDDFGAEEIDLLDLVSHHVATVLENAHLFESATVDGLTGLLRKETVMTELEREIDRAQRYGRPLTVAMLDIDRFKAINDAFGHLAGDLMLRQVAGELSDRVRSTDLLGRFGGEEFLLLLPESDVGAARAVVEKLRQAVERLEVRIEGRSVGVTISIGLAALQDLLAPLQATPETLIAAADRSLYQAKRGGRNRIAIGATG